MFRIGFTGTSKGTTVAQHYNIEMLLRAAHNGEFHHGDCVGADNDAHDIATALGSYKIFIHPPENSKMRAFCQGFKVYDPKPYLDRNQDVVDATALLIAAPRGMREVLRSGTWATVRYARKLRRGIVVVYPDGKLELNRSAWKLKFLGG